MAILLRVTNDLIGKAVRNHPLKSPLALAIEAVIPGRLEAVCREYLYLKPDIEIKLPIFVVNAETMFDKCGICVPYDAELDLESHQRIDVQLAVLQETESQDSEDRASGLPASA